MYYIAGGIYGDEFKIVGPVGPFSKIYISDKKDGILWNTTKHHAHYYKLNNDLTKAVLVYKSLECDFIPAPEEYNLTEQQINDIQSCINSGDIIN